MVGVNPTLCNFDGFTLPKSIIKKRKADGYCNAVNPRNTKKATMVAQNIFRFNNKKTIKPIISAATRSNVGVVAKVPDGIKIILAIKPASIA